MWQNELLQNIFTVVWHFCKLRTKKGCNFNKTTKLFKQYSFLNLIHLYLFNKTLFSADGEKTAEEEDEDENGTRQLKKDVGFLFSTLEQDFEESKSARAKLRERIKKVKSAIKEADDAEATENGETTTKESEEEKDKRRAELREKFRLQREAKKKAKAEAGQW